VCATATTNTGRKTVQLAAGLEPDPFGREANIEATLPDLAGESTVTELKDELNAVHSELKKVRKENNMLTRQRNDAIEEAQKAREEVRGEINDVMEMVYPFASGMSGNVNQKQNGHSPDRDLDELRKELMPDD